MANKWTEETLQELGEEMLEFCRTEPYPSFSKFAKSKGKGTSWINSMRKQCPSFVPYIDKAKEILDEVRGPKGRHLGNTQPKVYTPEVIEKLGKELIACVEEDGVWHLSEFSERHKKVDSWIYDLGDRYSNFHEYLTRARRILGRKMFEYGMEKNPNSWMLKTWMPRFLNERTYHLDDLKEETTIKAEATRDAITKDPDHPFWSMLGKYMEDENDKKTP
jgi:hypothetical protein